MSSRAKANAQQIDDVSALISAGREYSTAAVMLHGVVAQRFGLSTTDLKTLDVLQRLGKMTAGEIAAHTKLATASVTSLIDRLESKGLVRRQRDAKDRRKVVVEPTPKLGTSVAPLFEALNRRLRARFARYTPGQRKLIADFLLAGAHEMFNECAKLADE